LKITPALPNPYQRPAQQERGVVGAVHESLPVRDGAAERNRRAPMAQPPDSAARDHLEPSSERHLVRQTDHPARVSRALASYAGVANQGEQNSLRELLGFDAYA
jgi:hypothetical protein